MMKYLSAFLIIWITISPALHAQTPNKLTPKEKKNGWVLLFDGVSSAGWATAGGAPVPEGWEVKNGSLTAKAGGKGGDLVTINEYSDFELSIDYNIKPGVNSGVKYFFTKYEVGGNLGTEYQIIDDKQGEDIHKANHLTGSFYDVLPPNEAKKKINTPGQWNTLRIIAKNGKVQHWLNGVKILEFIRGSKEFTDAVALSKFNKTTPAFGTVSKGRILLQEHGGEVSFRNLKIKIL